MSSDKNIVKLKLDVIFKKMFANKKNENTLKKFLESVLELPDNSITNIVMDNVELLPEDIDDKFSRLDILMNVGDKQINIEMQICNEKEYESRTLFYWSKLYSGSLKSGGKYSDLPQTICINIINFNMFDDTEDFHSHFQIMEKNRHTVLTDKMAIHFFELKKINKKPDKDNKMQLWMQLINAETEGELEMLEQTNVKEIQEAVLILREMSADEKMKELARRRELALHDRITDIEVSREEGRIEGLKEGEIKGANSVIEKMRKSGMTEEQIQMILNQ
ncbi:MAG: Rpn family recombination-promoting nuclease/putative transposase [Oscillospiraceae bacterium]